jgi:hypothetical protein
MAEEKDTKIGNLTILQRLWLVSPMVAVMAVGLWITNNRIDKLEQQLLNCYNGRIQDLKLIHSGLGDNQPKSNPYLTFAILPNKEDKRNYKLNDHGNN